MRKYSLKGAAVSTELMQQLCALRLSIVQLKPDINPQEDFEKFAAFVRQCQYVDYAIDNHQIQAFFVLYHSQQQINGQRVIVLEPEFGFVSPEYRQENFVQKAFSKILKQLKIKYWYKPIYIVGCAYPHSFVSFMKQFEGNTWTLQNHKIPTQLKSILTNFLERKTGNLAITDGIVAVPTLHNEQTPAHLARLNKNPYYQSYMQQNPDWVKGYTLAFITQVSWWALLKGFFKGKR